MTGELISIAPYLYMATYTNHGIHFASENITESYQAMDVMMRFRNHSCHYITVSVCMSLDLIAIVFTVVRRISRVNKG